MHSGCRSGPSTPLNSQAQQSATVGPGGAAGAVAAFPASARAPAGHRVTRLLPVPKPGSCDPQTPLAQLILRHTAPGSGEFNDMQQVVFIYLDVAGIGGQQASRQ